MHSFHQFVRNMFTVFLPTSYLWTEEKKLFWRYYFYWQEIQGKTLIKCCSFSGVWDRQTEVHDKALWWLIPFVAINADSSPPPHRHILDFIRYCSDVCSNWVFRERCMSWLKGCMGEGRVKAEYFSGHTAGTAYTTPWLFQTQFHYH